MVRCATLLGTAILSMPTDDAAPVVSTVSASSANAVLSGGGGTVTISGLSFGAAGPTATASLTASEACGSSAWTSATTVACAPQAYGGSAAVRTAVSVSAVAGTLTGQFSFDGALHCCPLQHWFGAKGRPLQHLL